MKVLSILPESSTPSGMIFAHRQIRSLEELGVENKFFYIPPKGTTFIKILKLIRELWEVIATYQPDLLHVHYGTAYAFFSAYSNTKPLVITFQGSDLNTLPKDSLKRTMVKKTLSNLAILRAGKAICVSNNLKQNFWWEKKKAIIIPAGINISEFYPMIKAEARKKLNFKEEEKIVLFNGNNPVVKRLDLALEAIKIVQKTIPEARLEILTGIIGDSGIIPILLNAVDCLLICSDNEGSPTMVKEAMACNVPIVGVDVGDVAERLREVNHSIVTGKDPLSLANAIMGIIQAGQPSTGREKLIADQLTEDLVAKRLVEVYQQVTNLMVNG